MKSQFLARAGTVVLLGATLGCPDANEPEPPPPANAGRLVLVLESSHADLGAVIVALSAQNLSAFSPAGYSWSGDPVTGNAARVLLRGRLTVGPIAYVTSADRNQPFSATVIQAAAGRGGGYKVLDPAAVRIRLVIQ